jgi:hypothetical protein
MAKFDYLFDSFKELRVFCCFSVVVVEKYNEKISVNQ